MFFSFTLDLQPVSLSKWISLLLKSLLMDSHCSYIDGPHPDGLEPCMLGPACSPASPETLYFSHAEVTQMFLPQDLCTSCFLFLKSFSFPFTPLQPQFDHHSWGKPMLTFPDQKKSSILHHEPMLCFIYCTCNSTFIQFLKLISASSSFPLPSPYLVLCSTQKKC